MKIGTAVLALSAVLAVSLPPTLSAREIKVGVILSYSGGSAQLGQQIDRGMTLYYNEHKAELGKDKLVLIKRDDKGPNADTAKVLAQELITRDKVQMLAGFVYSPNIMAIAPMVNEAKVPTVIMNAGTAEITTMSPYYARVSFSMWHAGYTMGRYAAQKLHYKTAAVGYTDYPPGKDSLAAFKAGFESAGGKVVDAIPMGGPAQVPDFTPFFQRVKNDKPDAFFVFVPAGAHAAAVAKTYSDLGMKAAGIALIGPGDITQDTELSQMPKEAAGIVTSQHYDADLDNPQNKAFVAAWKKAYGADSTPDFMGEAGYDGMAAIFHAIKATKGAMKPDAVMASLKGWKFQAPRGPIEIDPATRDIVMNEYISEVVVKDGRLGIKTLDTVPGVKDPCKDLKLGPCAKH
jgi:branched-chain amino acid transport system substrate-binding protein